LHCPQFKKDDTIHNSKQIDEFSNMQNKFSRHWEVKFAGRIISFALIIKYNSVYLFINPEDYLKLEKHTFAIIKLISSSTFSCVFHYSGRL